MPDRLPPLTALRAFEAAARHMSFAKAAEELHVTPAALSFQIKSLEEHLGQPVFRRLNRAVELTEAGEVLSGPMSRGFAEIAAGWARARRLADQSILTVTAGPAFTALWLAPRLFSFAGAHPEIELRFSATLRILDFDRDDVDLAIRFGQGSDEGLVSLPLVEEWMTPMMTPALAERVSRPSDLAALPLIHDGSVDFLRPAADWAAWFAAMGIDAKDVHGPRFNQADHAVGAALAGAGAILGRISMAETALREGRLVMPFRETLRARAQYRIVCPEGYETRPQSRAFIDWILTEAKGFGEFDEDRVFVDAGER
jgi:LysR family glycine cleavage system transcriptional activator